MTALTNPVFAVPGISVRDPAAIWHDGLCHLFYSRQSGEWNSRASWDIGMVTTRDFREFSPEMLITPPGYASPGNIVCIGDQWILAIQFYPWPSEIALLFSSDLVYWSAPQHILPADTGPRWDTKHGPIDPWLFQNNGQWHCIWVNILAGTDCRAFGVSSSHDLQKWKNLTPDPPLLDGAAYAHDGGVENCSILCDGNTWHFFASVGMSRHELRMFPLRTLSIGRRSHPPMRSRSRRDRGARTARKRYSWTTGARCVAGMRCSVMDWTRPTGSAGLVSRSPTTCGIGTRSHEKHA